MKPLTTRDRHSGDCQNPLCDATLKPIKDGWRRTTRLYCNDTCKLQAWLIRKVAVLFRGILASRALEILEAGGRKTTEKAQAVDFCDICEQQTLAKDRDYGNGEWRGNLCGSCNIGLGHFKDDPDRLQRAAEYLRIVHSEHAERPKSERSGF